MTAQEFMFAHGQCADNIDTEQGLNAFWRQMRLGLEGKGGLPMIPTYLSDIDRSSIVAGDKRILIDAGGTNFRSALGSFDADGHVHIEQLVRCRMPASDGELSKEEFYAQIARNVQRLLPQSDTLGFCFSYPVQMGEDIDGIVQPFTKEVKAPQAVGTKVGAETVAACKALDGRSRRIVILNDTVATLLGGMALFDEKFSAYIGYIYGTGTNACYVEDASAIAKLAHKRSGKMLVNTELGTFDGFALGDIDRAAVALTDSPSRQLFEKMTSGKYLASVIYQALLAAQREGLISPTELRPFDLKEVSDFLEGNGRLCGLQNADDVRFVRDVCRLSVERAAKMGAIVNAALAISSCCDKSLPVAVVAEGTTFNKLSGYRSCFEGYLGQILHGHGVSYRLVQGEELNLVGTLMATMALR